MPDHREKKLPSAKIVYMPVRIYAQPSGKFFAFGEKAIKKQHKTVICDQKFQKKIRLRRKPYICSTVYMISRFKKFRLRRKPYMNIYNSRAAPVNNP